MALVARMKLPSKMAATGLNPDPEVRLGYQLPNSGFDYSQRLAEFIGTMLDRRFNLLLIAVYITVLASCLLGCAKAMLNSHSSIHLAVDLFFLESLE